MQEDPARAAAEYLAQFRSDLEAFVSREAVEACIDWGVFERPYQPGIGYIAGIDAAGGSGRDAMTLCIGHLDYTNSGIVIDCLREHRPPFSPEIVASEFSAVIKSYHISTIYSDRFGGDWVKEQFRKFGVTCEPAPKVKNQLYVDLLPCVNSKRIRLLDHTRCINQLIGLERSTGRSEIIDHAPGQSDDVINSVALVASLALSRATFDFQFPFANRGDVLGDADDPEVIKRNAKEEEEFNQNFQWHWDRYDRAVRAGAQGVSFAGPSYNVFGPQPQGVCDSHAPVPPPPPEIAANLPIGLHQPPSQFTTSFPSRCRSKWSR